MQHGEVVLCHLCSLNILFLRVISALLSLPLRASSAFLVTFFNGTCIAAMNLFIWADVNHANSDLLCYWFLVLIFHV